LKKRVKDLEAKVSLIWYNFVDAKAACDDQRVEGHQELRRRRYVH
jgi:hypothetical protein